MVVVVEGGGGIAAVCVATTAVETHTVCTAAVHCVCERAAVLGTTTCASAPGRSCGTVEGLGRITNICGSHVCDGRAVAEACGGCPAADAAPGRIGVVRGVVG